MTFSFLTVVFAQTAQTITITAVTNSADFQPGFPQKGSLASVFTTGLQGAPGIYNAHPEYYPLENVLNGVEVWINFLRAPILSLAFLNGYQQINVQVPWEGEREPLYVEVFQNGVRAHAESGQAAEWSVFFEDANGYVVAQHVSDYSAVTPQNPAHAGEYIAAYGINLAPVFPTQVTGVPAPAQPLAISFPPLSMSEGLCGMHDDVGVGPATAGTSYVGLTPGTIGVYQINFQIPKDTGVGDVPLVFVRILNLKNLHAECPGGDTPKSSRPVKLPIQ
jgi:uncharacterized protein (TIGR03437 family)